MQLVHRADGEEAVLATTVETADSLLARARGLMFRRSMPEDHALAFRFRRAAPRTLHMVFVPFDIDAVWTRDGEVTGVERLRAWTGLGRAVGDAVYELPAGAAAAVAPGDEVVLSQDGSSRGR